MVLERMCALASELLTVRDARELILSATSRLEAERVEIAAALNRALAQDVEASGDVPPFPCSAMDGYAVLSAAAGGPLRLIGESRAGAPFPDEVCDGQAVRISTGAAVPDGAIAVIRQEDVEDLGDRIEPSRSVNEGENIRYPGEDMAAGTKVLKAGTVLGAAELGAAVAAGAGSVLAVRRPRAAVLSTGDELRPPGERLGPGEIYNSNALMLTALAGRFGAITEPPRILPDDREATEAGLSEALSGSDVVIVSGGVSVGPHDHVKPALRALGVRELLWGVALAPGKPTWFGLRDRQLVFGLPGNPVSAFVTFSLFAGPALLALQGATSRARAAEAVLAEAVRRNPQREQAVRVRLEQRGATLTAVPNGPQGSHIVTSLLGADALAMIAPGEGMLDAGTTVALEPLPSWD